MEKELLEKIDQILHLPLSDYHKLKLVLRQTLKALRADRCWLLYPCRQNADKFLVPIEETTPDYPGASQIKAYIPAGVVFEDIARVTLTSTESVSFDLSSPLCQVAASGYELYKIKSQMACQIPIKGAETWAIGIHHCAESQEHSDEEKNLLTAVAKRISHTLKGLLDIPNLVNAAELSTEILDNGPLAQVIYNLERQVVYANNAYCDMNQRPLSEMIHQYGEQFLSKEKQHLFKEFFDEIKATGHGFAKGQKITGDGQLIHTENTGTLITYNGEPHYLITAKDITRETKSRNDLHDTLDIQHAILEATDDGVLVEDSHRNIIAINQNFYDYFKITPVQNNGDIKTLDLLTAGLPVLHNPEEIKPIVTKLHPTSKERNLATLHLLDGTILHMDSFPLIHLDQIKGRVWYFKNITKTVRSTQALENALDIHRAIMEASDDGLLVEDTNRRIISVNQVFLETFDIQIEASQIKGKTAPEVFTMGAHLISNTEEANNIVFNLSPTKNEKTSTKIYLKDDSILDLTSFPLIRDNTIHGRVWYFKNITEKHNLTEKLSFEATHDSLTKLTNRRGFDEKLKQVIKQIETDNAAHALLYLDLDQFKIINDTSGHSAGDIALIEVSKLLSSLLRQADLLARVGGDEFSILLPNCSLNMAKKIGEKICQSIDEYVFSWEGNEYHLGVSIGIISLDCTVDSYEDALKLADTSCYLAKEAGRNRIHVHTTSDQAVMQRLQQGNVVSQIQEALRTDQFVCYLQKICPVKTGNDKYSNLSIYEVLVRMLDQKGVLVAPFVFLPAAERYKLMHKIDHWVIENSIQNMAEIQDQIGCLSINLSGQTIAHEDTYDVIVNVIERSGMPTNKLCFEITETAAISNPQVGIEFLNKLRALGCKIALDDFGTGLSSYEYLKKLPADILKIDGQFIKGMLTDELDLAMVKSINEIGHLMGKKTVGEFVENAEIFDQLKEIGVDYAQGYHLHKPCSMQSVIEEQRLATGTTNLNLQSTSL
ncbi:hypothetical protein A9Q85_00765 [Cycloclasticus sp. 44_32_T64]|nr:hypothetical protein A9Q85_00765 [Cycloclasticus sp. 44_32_T64]